MLSNSDFFFPPSERVFYEKAPLTQVICQLRFPSILRIEAQPPAGFQERIRNIFPLVERRQGIPDQLPAEIVQFLGATQTRAEYSFKTEDGKSTLNLSPEAISVSTAIYSRWELFREYLQPSIDALLAEFQPLFFQRVGLRYINIIQRSTMGIQGQRWSELLRREILGELSLTQFEDNATEVTRNIRVNIPGDPDCTMFMQHGFAKKQNDTEQLYRLDFDFYRSAKTEVTDVNDTLKKFNAMVGRTFRGCITEKLHQSLGPVPL